MCETINVGEEVGISLADWPMSDKFDVYMVEAHIWWVKCAKGYTDMPCTLDVLKKSRSCDVSSHI